jgi:hypothetical protein
MLKSVTRLVLVAAVLAEAILPSVAAARPDGPAQSYSDAAAAVQALAPPPAHAISAPSMAAGFNWGDAVFGAAGMLVLIAVSSGTALAVRRRTRISPATS